MTKDECEQMGLEWVAAYIKDDGTYVHGFCRKSQGEQ